MAGTLGGTRLCLLYPIVSGQSHIMRIMYTAILLTFWQPIWAQQDHLEIFKNYFRAGSDEQWAYTKDTVKLWFEVQSGDPILKIKGQAARGKWKEWDEEMHTTIEIDSIWYLESTDAIKGYFYENNDFYKLIGKPPTKTLRTYWFEENKINEILIYWIPEENTPSGVFLKPIVEWAEIHAEDEIAELYPNNSIVPSKENAVKWRNLINRYLSAKGN